MAFDKEYWTRLASEAGLPAEQVEALAANEKLMNQLAQGFKRQDEFSRGMDEARRTREEAEQAKQLAIENYQQNIAWLQSNEAKLRQFDQLAASLNGGNGNGGQPNPAPKPTGTEPKYLTQDELLASQRNFYNLVARQIPKLHKQYRTAFGEDMPDELMDQIEQMAVKPENIGRSASDLYHDIITPKIEEKRKADFEAKLAEAKKTAFEEGMAKGRMREPSDSIAAEDTSPLYLGRPTDPAKAPDDRTLMNNFMQTLDNPAGAVTH